jgi:hypothetical protein
MRNGDWLCRPCQGGVGLGVGGSEKGNEESAVGELAGGWSVRKHGKTKQGRFLSTLAQAQAQSCPAILFLFLSLFLSFFVRDVLPFWLKYPCHPRRGGPNVTSEPEFQLGTYGGYAQTLLHFTAYARAYYVAALLFPFGVSTLDGFKRLFITCRPLQRAPSSVISDCFSFRTAHGTQHCQCAVFMDHSSVFALRCSASQ